MFVHLFIRHVSRLLCFLLSLSDSTAGKPHKAEDTLADRNIMTRLFYGCYPFFAYCCVGTELFYVTLYLLVFIPEAALNLGGVTITLHAVSFFLFFTLGIRPASSSVRIRDLTCLVRMYIYTYIYFPFFLRQRMTGKKMWSCWYLSPPPTPLPFLILTESSPAVD